MWPVRLIRSAGKTEISLCKTRGLFVVRGGRFTPASTAAGDFMNQITPKHPSRVAIVDDDRASRESICLVIQSAGYDTVAFESGEELFEQGGLDGSVCLVTDYRLPGLSGLEIQQRLAEENIAIPVILISGFADVAIAVKAMQQGALTLLQKPYSHEELLAVVADAVNIDKQRRAEQSHQEGARQRLSRLNPKEWDVVRQMLEGHSNKVVASKLRIGLRTVERRRHDVFSKTNVDSEVKLAELIKEAGIDVRIDSVSDMSNGLGRSE